MAGRKGKLGFPVRFPFPPLSMQFTFQHLSILIVIDSYEQITCIGVSTGSLVGSNV